MERREKSSRLIIILFICFFIWILLQFLAPLALPQGSVNDLTGFVGLADNEDQIENMPAPWGSIYGCGDRLCHQKEHRSFILNDNQMPFCVRCVAIWLGLAIGLASMIFYKIELNGKFLLVILFGLIPIAIDGLGQHFELWESTNLVRFITGLLVGIVCGIAIGLIIDESREIFRSKKIEK
ncbi:MAG: DUF2085 domain-containing protein [Thermoplasmatales archaeon]|nr:DUF2085 domain-containing protein [Thermoplasmatales archaeon]